MIKIILDKNNEIKVCEKTKKQCPKTQLFRHNTHLFHPVLLQYVSRIYPKFDSFFLLNNFCVFDNFPRHPFFNLHCRWKDDRKFENPIWKNRRKTHCYVLLIKFLFLLIVLVLRKKGHMAFRCLYFVHVYLKLDAFFWCNSWF